MSGYLIESFDERFTCERHTVFGIFDQVSNVFGLALQSVQGVVDFCRFHGFHHHIQFRLGKPGVFYSGRFDQVKPAVFMESCKPGIIPIHAKTCVI